VSDIEAAITRLVREAPEIDAVVVTELQTALMRVVDPPAAQALAQSIHAIVALVANVPPRVDPGIALPALAMACATLTDPRSKAREHDAARYEIDTLTPMPGAPDVPVDQLMKRR
jgi:hypothetical protein